MAAGESRDQAGPLERILDNPQLARVVPHLQPELLHRIIERYGLEDCAELVALATPAQLVRIFDQDLWRAAPGRDEHFDPARFGVWIEVLLELRKLDLSKRPGLSELLDWVGYLEAVLTPPAQLTRLPAIGALLKQHSDQQRAELLSIEPGAR